MAKNEQKVLDEAKELFADIVDFESEQRSNMEQDLRFAAGDQWPENVRRARENDPYGARPCLTMDKTNQYVRQVVNDARQNKPAIKVSPIDDKGDIETAKIYQGVCRHIESVSNAQIAYQTALDNSVKAGLGWFRIVTEVVNQSKNEQEIRIKRIPNIFSVYPDQSWSEPDGSDMMHCFITDQIPRKVFEKRYPKADLVDWEGKDERSGWVTQDDVRIAEFMKVIEQSTNILILDTGEEMTEDEYWASFTDQFTRPQVIGTMEDLKRHVNWYKMTAGEILEETIIPCKWIPVVPVVGNEHWIDGKRELSGMIRWVSDAQRAYNYARSAFVEQIALAPKAPFLAAEGQLEQYEDQWKEANTRNFPYLTYSPVTIAGKLVGAPQRQMPPAASQAWAQDMQIAERDIQAGLGMYAASLGSEGQEKSGRAILARQQEGDTSTFHYIDNLSISVRHGGRISVDMVPNIYDTRRIMRIIGEDDKPSHVTVDPNQTEASKVIVGQDGAERRIYNPAIGLYDVSVEVGPSYNTKRQEAATAMMEITKSNPEMMPIVGDLMVRAMDWPMADKIADRLKSMVPPQALANEEASSDDAKIQAAVQQVSQQAEMQAQQAMQAIEQLQQQLQQAQQEAQAMQQKQNDAQGKLAIDAEKVGIEQLSVQVDMFRAETERMKALSDANRPEEVDNGGEELLSVITPIMQQLEQIKRQMEAMMQTHQTPQAALPPVINVTIEKGGAVRKEMAIQSPSGDVYRGFVEGEEE